MVLYNQAFQMFASHIKMLVSATHQFQECGRTGKMSIYDYLTHPMVVGLKLT